MPSVTPRAAMLLERITGPKWTATVLLVLAMIVGVVSSWTVWDGYYLAKAFTETDSVSMAQLVEADARMVTFGWLLLGAMLLAACGIIFWLVRARANAERLCTAEHTQRRGWVIGAWFVPVVNLMFPYQLVRDVWKASRPDARTVDSLKTVPSSPLVKLWWALWIAAFAIDRIYLGLFRGDIETVEDIRTLAIFDSVGSLTLVAAGVLLIQVMNQVTGWQEAVRQTVR